MSLSLNLINLAADSGIDDLFDVKRELNPVSAKWKSIGVALRLNPNTLDGIEAKNSGDPSTCLISMVTEWLRKNYNVKRFGEPTWQRLVETVGDPAGGENMAIARDMASRHKVGGTSHRSIFTVQWEDLHSIDFQKFYKLIVPQK